MVDIVDPEKRSQMMAGIKAKNTKPEVLVRQILHKLGFRFRLHHKDLPGKPDVVLSKWNAVIFVHGCFWHGHEDCTLFRLPKTRTEFWANKIASNKMRDDAVREAYKSTNWRVIEIWECATKGRKSIPPIELARQLEQMLVVDTQPYCQIVGN